jgi:hypothetical protein
MKDCENLSEISIEDEKGNTIIEYYSNSVPRIGESISYKSKLYKAYDVIHKVVEHDNDIGTYITVLVY